MIGKARQLRKNKVKETVVLCQIQLSMAGLESRARLQMRLTRRPLGISPTLSLSRVLKAEAKSPLAGTWVTDSSETMQERLCLGRRVVHGGTKFAKAETGLGKPLV